MEGETSARQPSIAWLYTAQDECALDKVAFSQIEPEIERAVWDAVGNAVDGAPQGLQAFVEVLGEEWRSKHVPHHDNNPSLLLLPYLAGLERDALIREVKEKVMRSMRELECREPLLFERYSKTVEDVMRAQLVQQLAVEAQQVVAETKKNVSREHVLSSAAHSMGAALAEIWQQQPQLRHEHLPLMRGHILPPLLRAHVWTHALGGDDQGARVDALLRRAMEKDGWTSFEHLESTALAVAVRRAAQELFSSRKALQTKHLTAPATLNTAVRLVLRLELLAGSAAAASTRRLQRALLLLAPILCVFPAPKEKEKEKEKEGLAAEALLSRCLGALMAVDAAVPTAAEAPAVSLAVASQVQKCKH